MMKPTETKPNKRRRGRGEGSIFQRTDGRWVATISMGFNGASKRIRRTVYGRTKTEVQEELAKLKGQQVNGTLAAPSRETLGQYLAHWLQDVARPRLRRGTFANYEGVNRNHITPRIGNVQLQKLRPADVQRLYSGMEQDGATAHARKLAHCVLHKALKDAVRSGDAVRNVCDAVDSPKITRPEMKTLDAEQAQRLLAEANSDRLAALYWVAVTCGLRLGELFGLQWPDIDLDAGTLSVRRSQSDVQGKLTLNEPKTAKGRRLVELPAETVAALLEHRKHMLVEGHARADRVFCNVVGGPLRRPDFHRRSFKPMLKRAGLPPIRFHDLRHTSATLLLSQGVHPKVVQERLGHANISITLDTYSHVMPTMQREASDKLGALLAGANGCKMAVKTG